MAKVTLTFEDTPSGVLVTGYGVRIPSVELERTDAQNLALLIKQTLEEHYAGQKFWRVAMPALIND